jgi:ribosome-associated protein
MPAPPADAKEPARDRVRISSTCVIDADEIEWRFQPSGGPGGQHANKTSTRVEARFDIARSPSLTDGQRALLLDSIGPRLVVTVDETRSQARNRSIALDRLRDRLAAGLERAAPRRPTKPSRAVTERRLDDKKRRSDTKRSRSAPVERD